jgi:hypothetical protein
MSTGIRSVSSNIYAVATIGTATTTVLTVTADVWVMALYVKVTTTIAATSCTIGFQAKVGALTAVAVSNTTADLNAMTAGQILMPVTTFGTTMVNNANGVLIAVPITAPPCSFMMAGAGVIQAILGGTPASGAIQVQCLYVPMLPGAVVTA